MTEFPPMVGSSRGEAPRFPVLPTARAARDAPVREPWVLAAPSEADLVNARASRGRLHMVRAWDVVVAAFPPILILGWTTGMAMSQSAGFQPSTSSALGMFLTLGLVLCALIQVSCSADILRARDAKWPLLAAATAGLAGYVAQEMIVRSANAASLPFRGYLGAVSAAIVLNGAVVVVLFTRACAMWSSQPRRVLVSSPGFAVLLALDSVRDARAERIATAIVMPPQDVQSWLKGLEQAGYVRPPQPLSGKRWSITRRGRKLLDAWLDPSREDDRSPVNLGH